MKFKYWKDVLSFLFVILSASVIILSINAHKNIKKNPVTEAIVVLEKGDDSLFVYRTYHQKSMRDVRNELVKDAMDGHFDPNAMLPWYAWAVPLRFGRFDDDGKWICGLTVKGIKKFGQPVELTLDYPGRFSSH